MKSPLNLKDYKPETANVRPWPEIERHYIDLINQGWQINPLLELVRHILSSGLSNRLVAYTSMDKLVLGIYSPMEWNREALHIEFDGTHQTWYFKYYSKPFEPVEHERKYTVDKGIEKFENLIKILKWQ